MRRQSDLGPLLVIALGASLGLALRGGLRPDYEMRLARVRAAVEAAEGGCTVPFHLEAAPSDWSVVGSYDGTARLTPKGLAVELHGSTLAADRDTPLRGIVIGLAQAGGGGGWMVSRTADPIGQAPLERGVPRPIRPARVLIPGVTAADLTDGWLVLEHVIDAPDVEGGTAWTYLHAPATALHPLLRGGCEP